MKEERPIAIKILKEKIQRNYVAVVENIIIG